MTAHWLKYIDRLDGAYSDHTLRSYRSDFGMFAAWCRARRVPFLPASGDTVAAHIEDERARLKPGSLKRPLAAVRKLHHLADKAVTDLTKRDDGCYSVLIRRAKNDPEGAGRTAHLLTHSSELVDEWLAVTGARKGPLLRPVYQSRALALYLEPVTIGRVLKKLSKRADIQTEGLIKVTGHSLRVGAAQQLVLNGRGILQVMRAGGWRSMTVVARYVENVDLDVWS